MQLDGGTSLGKGAFLATFASEAIAVISDMRWAVVLIIILIVADFWWGRRECHIHYKEAKKRKSKAGQRAYEFRWSRAIRRTLNKLVDYIVIVLLGAVCGKAITEPLGFLTQAQMAGVGAIIAVVIEAMSIWGHIKAVHHLSDQDLGVLGKILSRLIRSKSEAVADALDEATGVTKQESNGNVEEE